MEINTNFSTFKKLHKNGKNQIIFHQTKCKSNKIIDNIINNFLNKKNSFIFESVEKRQVRGRYTIIGADPDKIWEFNEKKIYLIQNKIKQKIKGNPYFYLQKLVKDFNFPTPKNLPPVHPDTDEVKFSFIGYVPVVPPQNPVKVVVGKVPGCLTA